MIVPQMTTSEIVDEMIKNEPFIKTKSNILIKKLRRLSLKKKSTIEHFTTLMDNNKNKWFIAISINKKNHSIAIGVIYNNAEGFNIIEKDPEPNFEFEKQSYSHYDIHVLDRFNERYLKDTTLSRIDIFKKILFFPVDTVVYDKNDKNETFLTYPKCGSFLGYELEYAKYRIMYQNTFIAENMMFSNQKELQQHNHRLSLLDNNKKSPYINYFKHIC